MKFKGSTLETITDAIAVISEYQDRGLSLTLRQLYYRLVAADKLPNNQREYKRLGDIVTKARRDGMIPWSALTDRTRYVRANSHWKSPSHILDAVVNSYGIDMWANQNYRPIVLVEKDALIDIVRVACENVDVPYMSTRGYLSDSEAWSLAERFKANKRSRQRAVLIHLSDHDPSGLDMFRDLQRRLNDVFGVYPHTTRIALTREQIEDYSPPPNPAKETDSRFAGYMEEHGDSSWELDSLDPDLIVSIIEDEINVWKDEALWDDALQQLNREKAILRKAIEAAKAAEENGDEE